MELSTCSAAPGPLTHLGAGSEEQRVALQPQGTPYWPRLPQGEVGQGEEVGAGALEHHLQWSRARG